MDGVLFLACVCVFNSALRVTSFLGEEILGPLPTIYQLCQDECEATRELIDKERGLGAFQMEARSFDSRAL